MSRLASVMFVGVAVLGSSCLSANDDESSAARVSTVTICHIPPGNPWHAHTLAVSPSLLDVHLAHGDYLGECQVCAPGTTAACYDGPSGTDGVGACHAGTQTCTGAGYGACTGAVTPTAEVCGNGIDDDCDGVTDDGCVCAPGSTVSCYDGPAGTEGVGTCSAGTRVCNGDGTGYGACVGAVTPSADVCGDGLDSDCDGASDEGCVCTPGSTASCYGGPSGTEGVGTCSAGTQTCNPSGTGYGACVGDVTPLAEACGDSLDNDCDGVTDDGCVCTPGSQAACYTGPDGTAGVGACQAGAQTCNGTGTGYGACVGDVRPTVEVCGNAVDDDCDGLTDDGCVCTPGATHACYSGPPSTEDVGACRSGTETCNSAGTGYSACVGEVLPAYDTCGDGLDNDCDAVSDESCVCIPSSTASCYGGPSGTGGVGACHAGVQTCDSSGSGYGACTGDVTPVAEVCGDGIDNNCNGATDEGCVGDRAWRDDDRDGIQDVGEPGLSGVTFQLRLATTGALVAIAVSDTAGAYRFSFVPPGSYYFDVLPPSGWDATLANVGNDDTLDSDLDGEALTVEFTLSIGGSRSDLDCGFVMPTSCGDGTCAPSVEDNCNCPSDCAPVCGNGVCDCEETCSSCPSECGSCAPVCGDGTCDPVVEDCGNCPGDCPCWQPGTTCVGGQCNTYCGNGFCEPFVEDNCNCPTDCAPVCGNGTCDCEETCSSCPSECGSCVVCGDGVCDFPEDGCSCGADCGPCTP